MVKQRHDAIHHYEKAGRDELAAQEKFEISIIQTYLPEPLSEREIAALIDSAIAELGAQSIKDMSKVMVVLKSKLQGRAKMNRVSQAIKKKLG